MAYRCVPGFLWIKTERQKSSTTSLQIRPSKTLRYLVIYHQTVQLRFLTSLKLPEGNQRVQSWLFSGLNPGCRRPFQKEPRVTDAGRRSVLPCDRCWSGCSLSLATRGMLSFPIMVGLSWHCEFAHSIPFSFHKAITHHVFLYKVRKQLSNQTKVLFLIAILLLIEPAACC